MIRDIIREIFVNDYGKVQFELLHPYFSDILSIFFVSLLPVAAAISALVVWLAFNMSRYQNTRKGTVFGFVLVSSIIPLMAFTFFCGFGPIEYYNITYTSTTSHEYTVKSPNGADVLMVEVITVFKDVDDPTNREKDRVAISSHMKQ